MSYEVGYDDRWKRDIGYGVPSICDHKDCEREIHRGIAYVCGGEPFGGENGCGLFFCDDHMVLTDHGFLCERCSNGEEPFDPKPDTKEWIRWKLSDKSLEEWRKLNNDWVEEHKSV